MLIPKRQRSNNKNNVSSDDVQYGSFVPTPPGPKLARFQLPDSALESDLDGPLERSKIPFNDPFRSKASILTSEQIDSLTGSSNRVPDAGHGTFPQSSTLAAVRNQPSRPLIRHMSTPTRPTATVKMPLMQRMFSIAVPPPKTDSAKTEFSLQAYDQIKSREADFFQWMDKELNKVESFYKTKEDEAGQRLKILRDQLREMRNRRIEEIAEARRAQEVRKDDENAVLNALGVETSHHNGPTTKGQLHAWMQPIERILVNAKSRTTIPLRMNSAAPQKTGVTQGIRGRALSSQHQNEDGRDYVRKPHHDHEVPYRSAKRKLKLALKEFYRGLELLKSYALLNHKAFRKIDKKYDKAVNANPPLRYMSEKVNKAWFVQSNVLDSYLHTVEDLYARYFERGNHKVAVGKLRGSSGRPGEYTGSAFRSGLFVGIGAVFAIQGVVYSSDLLYHSPDIEIQVQTSFLLQIYAGYFLALYLFALFCLDCRIWVRNKINYAFIFEFDPRHHLDWRELAEFPAILAFLLGLFIWLNFSQYGPAHLFIYYPAILIFVTAVLIFLPAPTLFHQSRWWFVYSHVSSL
jgi:xenotropic and polytropic retrovirus receptor 1